MVTLNVSLIASLPVQISDQLEFCWNSIQTIVLGKYGQTFYVGISGLFKYEWSSDLGLFNEIL